jgi:hypothetical protein
MPAEAVQAQIRMHLSSFETVEAQADQVVSMYVEVRREG